MKSVTAAVVLLLAAGSFVGAGEPVVRDAPPAAVIAQFSQAIPPEPPVVGELTGQHQMAGGATCCRMHAGKAQVTKQASSGPCGCCRKSPSATNAKE